jgi:outer membrane protein TolC
MNKTFHFLLTILISTLPAIQAASQVITLDQCIEAALTSNPTLKASANEYEIDNLGISISRSGRYPSVSGEASGGLSEEYSIGNKYKTGYSGLTADQLIWQNKKVTSAITQARYRSLASAANYETRKQEIILAVKTAYFICLQQDQLYKIARDNVAKTVIFLDYAKQLYSIGTGRKSDILKAESDLVRAEFEQNAYLNSYRKSLNDLAMLSGLSSDKLNGLDSSWTDIPVSIPFEISDSLISMALVWYPELQAINNLGYSQQYKIMEARAAFFPALSLNTGYEWRYNPILQEQKGWYSMITLRWDLFNGNEKKYRVQSEKIKKEIYNYQADDIRNYLIKEVRNRMLSLLEAADQIGVTRSLMNTTSENLEMAKAQYKAGTGSMLELTDARVTDLQAHQDLIQAITNYRIMKANMEKLTGKTYEDDMFMNRTK